MDYGKVFRRAWDIIWNHKVLWIFGILASCGSGGGNGGGGGNFNTGVQTDNTGQLPPQMEEFGRSIQRFFENMSEGENVALILGVICLVLILALLFWAIGVYGRMGVIRGAVLADSGKAFTFGSLHRETWSRLGGGLWLNFLLGLLPAAVGIIFAFLAVLLTVGTMGIGLFCLFPIICILVPVFIAYSVYLQISNVSYVVDGLEAVEAIRKGWEVFRANLGNIIVMALVLFVGGILVGVVLAIPFVFIAAPIFVGIMTGEQETGFLISALCLVVALPVLIALNGVLQAYIHSAWTLAYQQMAPGKSTAVAKKTTRRKTS
jgi:hypothetical protein